MLYFCVDQLKKYILATRIIETSIRDDESFLNEK